ncbi:MAG: hypothetical protein J6386_18240 [Candidatus Synoicihabitans palmerolidicus]|nr:hypothetical protein [Candidatus Synoicihabitans palmerolidicus]
MTFPAEGTNRKISVDGILRTNYYNGAEIKDPHYSCLDYREFSCPLDIPRLYVVLSNKN